MKKMVLVIFASIHLNGMQQELQEAIAHSDVQKVSQLIKQSKQPVRTTRSRLVTEKIDLQQAHALAQRLADEQEENSQTLHNRHVYKRMAISAGTIVSSWIPFGICTYTAFTHGSWPDGTTVFGALAAGVAGTYHGIDQMQMGLSNEDAITNHAKHIAITHITHTAQEESESEESV